jgi:hypothetical protein
MKSIQNYEEFLNESSKSSIDMYTLTIGKHKDGHRVMTVHHWDRQHHMEDYLETIPRGDKSFTVNPKDLETVIKQKQKENNIADKAVFRDN